MNKGLYLRLTKRNIYINKLFLVNLIENKCKSQKIYLDAGERSSNR